MEAIQSSSKKSQSEDGAAAGTFGARPSTRFNVSFCAFSGAPVRTSHIRNDILPDVVTVTSSELTSVGPTEPIRTTALCMILFMNPDENAGRLPAGQVMRPTKSEGSHIVTSELIACTSRKKRLLGAGRH